MLLNKLHSENYTRFNENNQLVLPLNFEILIPEDDSVRLLSEILEGLSYKKLDNAYSPNGRKSALNPRIMFKILVYAYMNNIYSSRKIEQACKRDMTTETRTLITAEMAIHQRQCIHHMEIWMYQYQETEMEIMSHS